MPSRRPKVQKAAADRRHYERHRDEIRARVRNYQEQNKEKIRTRKAAHYRRKRSIALAAVRFYVARNHEVVLIRARDSHRRHRATRIEGQRRYRERNLEGVRAARRAWCRADQVLHPEKTAARQQARRAKILGVFVEAVSVAELYRIWGGRCGICRAPVRKQEASIDHVIPVSRGGEHSYRNAQLAHLSCNKRKGNKLPEEAVYGVR